MRYRYPVVGLRSLANSEDDRALALPPGSQGSHTTCKHASQASMLKPYGGNTTAAQCMTKGAATHNHTKKVSLKQYQGCTKADRPAAPHLDVNTWCARAPTGRPQTHEQGCVVQCAEPRQARACIQDASGADASGAKEHRQEAGSRDCRSNSFGARAARRGLQRGKEGCVHTA